MTVEEFRTALLARVLRAASENVVGAGDHEWTAVRPWQRSPRSRLRDAATRLGVRRARFDARLAAERLDGALANAAGFAATYDRLEAAPSRELLLDVVARRITGGFHVALPVAPRTFQATWDRTKRMRVGTQTMDGPLGMRLPLVEYRGIRMWADPIQLVAFKLGQYEPAAPGEIVVDGGAGFAETALAYAQQVGPQGRVVAVELDAENLTVVQKNLELTPGLAERITVVSQALWDSSGETMEYQPLGGASSATEGGPAWATTVKVDDLDLPRVDLLKLDVEGAEAPALRGAADTLREHRPKLAVAAYHRDDLAVLPKIIHDIQPAYRFGLGHFTPGIAETILTAR